MRDHRDYYRSRQYIDSIRCVHGVMHWRDHTGKQQAGTSAPCACSKCGLWAEGRFQ